jgi:coproporphyrinogen III oxidase-like Fe-S oxidoreductase
VSTPLLATLMREGTLQLPALPPLALYVHLPWCLRKCPYCDFNSHEAAQGIDAQGAQAYVDALRADLGGRLAADLGAAGGVRVHRWAVRPACSRPKPLRPCSAICGHACRWTPGCEITLEANPGTFERDRFRGYRAAGVTRLSVGVQSFSDAALRALGRVHDGRSGAAPPSRRRPRRLRHLQPGPDVRPARSDL